MNLSGLIMFFLVYPIVVITDYKIQGIPEQADIPPVARIPANAPATELPSQPPQSAQPTAVPASGPNANPLDLFPQVVSVEFLFIN